VYGLVVWVVLLIDSVVFFCKQKTAYEIGM